MMEKGHNEYGYEEGKPATKHRLSLVKVLCWVLIIFGAVSLIISVIWVSQTLAFIGLGLLFWGAILLFIQPEQYTKRVILDSTVIPPLETVKKIIQELNYKGKAVYLPPKYLKDPIANKIYISKQRDKKLPKPETILKHENKLFIENSEGILLTPPGAQLSNIFEKRLYTNFAKTDLKYITQNLPKLIRDDLELAENIEIETENNLIKTIFTNSIFKETYKKNKKLSHKYPSIGSPLSSAIACALTKATGKPITIEEIQCSDEGNIIVVTYQIIGKIEELLPEIKSEEPLPEPPAIQLRRYISPILTSLLLTAIGSIFLTQVAWITFYDMTVWGKDIVQIFFGPRTGQAVSLGIGMQIIHYFLLGLTSFLLGILTFLRNRSKV